MKKVPVLAISSALVLAIVGLGQVCAQMPSAKVSAGVRDIAVVQAFSATGIDWTPDFARCIKTPAQKDLFIDVSLEVGLTTDTKVMSKNLQRAEAEAEAMVKVKVLVDGVEALPGVVTYARRKQTMIAQFAGDLSNCLTIDPTSSALVLDEECIEPESLQLILETMRAHSFNFIAPDVTSGEHKIEILALIGSSSTVDGESGSQASANAYLGKGTVIVDSVRMLKGELPEL
ncbi:MAG: hypothetical protein GTN74_05200 [Proteobacteria bacterium]|nr:hypothetical protein [Pseudomonadota bacterium]NIS68889.1 hypothetical protein [Pseudomonadota bacterium]